MASIAGRGDKPVVSVVVPVYNVADYLAASLASISSQGVRDLEIIAVDDGSTDDSAAILAEVARSEPRLQIVTQPNGGLGAARNTGVTHARGEFLCFVDSDDLLAAGAIDRLLTTITATGSDLATGNVLRLEGADTSPARFLAETFERSRSRTHIHRFPRLIADRVAWNKLYRRSFWDEHDFRFPTGVHYEDQYVTLPAHYLARAVDVVREPVYLWRVRPDSDLASITQQRADPQSMRDRVHAVEYVSDFLARRGLALDKRRYDTSAVTHDLRYFLEIFDQADEEYRREFLAAVAPYLRGVDPRSFERLPSIRRLQWLAAQRGDDAGLAELVRFEREDLPAARATRSGRHWYGEFPGRADSVAPEAFRVRSELRLVSTIDELMVDADAIRVRGRAAIDLVGAATRRLRMIAVPEGRALPVVMRTTVSSDGSFVAEAPLAALRRASRGRPGQWRLVLHSRDHELRRVAVWHEPSETLVAASRVTVDGGSVRARETRLELLGRGRLRLTTGRRPPVVVTARVDGHEVLDVVGDLGDMATAASTLLASRVDRVAVTTPLHVDRPIAGSRTGPAVEGARFVGRLPLELLLAHGSGDWSIAAQSPGDVRRLVLGAGAIGATKIERGGATLSLETDDAGYLLVRVP